MNASLTWGLLLGICLAHLLYPLVEEWQQRPPGQRTRKMGEHFANGRRGHVAKGWMSDYAGSGSASL
jgi:hypothetical protein